MKSHSVWIGLVFSLVACASGSVGDQEDIDSSTVIGATVPTASAEVVQVVDSIEGLLASGAALEMIYPFYAEDAVQLVPEQPPFVGKPAILARLDEWSDFVILERQHQVAAADVQGDFAFVWGIVTQRYKLNPKAEPRENSATMLRVFRKQQDGSWKIALETWSYR
jgi:ketosteroid isomerase-like protein